MSAFERKMRRAGANGPVVTEDAVAAFVEALKGTPLDVAWKVKRWTEPALRALEVGFDSERYTIPIRDDGGALVGLVRYLIPPLRFNGAPKSIADAGSIRDLVPRLVGESVVWIVEGEPDAITARSAGLPAIAVPGTSGWKSEYAERFRDCDVVVCCDCDGPGRKLAKQIAADLVGVAATVRAYDLAPKRDDGYDLSDALTEGVETVKELQEAGELARREAANVNPEPVPEPEPPPLVVEGIPLSRFAAEPVEWLWQRRIPRGMLTLLTGMPFVGKSQLSLSIAAECDEPVLIATAEDPIGPVVRPRAEAVGADADRIIVVQVRRHGMPDGLTLPEDAARFEDLVRTHAARLLIIDPLNAYLSMAINSFVDASMRQALAPLHRIAETSGCAVLALGHLNKNTTVTNTMLRTGGSIALPAAVRSALLLVEADPEDDDDPTRVLAHTNCNVGVRQRPHWAYEIKPVLLDPDGKRIETSRIERVGDWEGNVEDLLGSGANTERGHEVAEAIEWLEGELSAGAVAAKNIVARARASGIRERTLYTAKEKLGVISERVGFGIEGIWSWRMPEGSQEEDSP